MRKTVICTKCKLPFLVQGTVGTLKESPQSVTCPYLNCYAANEISWPIGESCKTTRIHSKKSK
jgi:hypothetical protein